MKNNPDPEQDLENVRANRDDDGWLERWSARLILLALGLLILWSLI